MRTLTCATCGKVFESINPAPVLKATLGGTDEEPTCYGCALTCITGGRAPEEGDFNSARIVSGEMSEQEWRWLKEDLEATEQGRSIREYEPPEYEPLEEYNDDDERCEECGAKVEDNQRLCSYCTAMEEIRDQYPD